MGEYYGSVARGEVEATHGIWAHDCYRPGQDSDHSNPSQAKASPNAPWASVPSTSTHSSTPIHHYPVNGHHAIAALTLASPISMQGAIEEQLPLFTQPSYGEPFSAFPNSPPPRPKPAPPRATPSAWSVSLSKKLNPGTLTFNPNQTKIWGVSVSFQSEMADLPKHEARNSPTRSRSSASSRNCGVTSASSRSRTRISSIMSTSQRSTRQEQDSSLQPSFETDWIMNPTPEPTRRIKPKTAYAPSTTSL